MFRTPLTIAAVVLASLVLTGGPARAAERKPAVLAVLLYAEAGRPWMEALQKQGYEVQVLDSPRSLTWDLLKQFNVLLVSDFPIDPEGAQTGRQILWPQSAAVWQEAVAKFLAEGGGVFALGAEGHSDLGGGGGWPALIDELLQPYDAQVLFEQVFDPRHSWVQPRKIAWRYGWTTNLAASPLTQGLGALYYPEQAFMYSPVTAPLKLGKDWQVVARGADTAASHAAVYPGAIHAPSFREATPGTYATAPPLLATRTVGKGRIALSGISPFMSILWQGHPAAEDICLTRGDGATPSDLGKLYANLYRWLAEPSLQSAALGGYAAPPPEAGKLPNDWGDVKSIDWSQIKIGEQPHAAAGMIGAHTQAGGGAGTVAEWVAAARQAGLDWLAFTEDFTKLTPEKWEKLRADCQAASDDKFLAVPGIEAHDVAGNRWVQFGPSVRWWPAGWLSADGKQIKDAQNFGLGQGMPPTAPIFVKTNPAPAWDYRFLSCFSVVAGERGKTQDESLDGYLIDQEQEDEIQPIAVNLMYAPADLGRLGDFPRTYLRAPGQEWRHWFLEPVYRSWNAYVSNGPRITAWDGVNLTRSTLGEYYVPGTERWRVRLKAHSDAGLQEIRVYDGTELYARYLPRGPECDLTLDGLHDRSRRLVAVVTDQQGRQAVTHCLLIVDFLGRLQMCSDRNNTMPNSIVRGEDGKVIMDVPATMQDKGRWPNPIARPAVDWWYLGLPGWDGGFGWSGFGATPVVALEGWKRQGDYFGRTGNVVVGKDVVIQSWRLDNEYLPVPGGATAAAINLTPYLPFRALEPYSAEVREVALLKRPHDLSLTVVEGQIKFKRDVTFDSQAAASLQLGQIWPTPKVGEYDHFALVRPGQEALAGMLPPPEKMVTFEGAVPPGSYYAIFPCLTGAQGLMVLDEGYSLRAEGADNWVRGYVNLSRPGEKIAAGTVLPYRYLCVVGDYDGPATNAEFEWLRESLGIGGKPAYEVQTKQGKVRGTRLFLDLDAQDGGCTGQLQKTTTRRLPVRLPIRVYGLNPHWSAAVWDRQRQTLEPFGIGDGVGYASVDLDRGPADVYVGNLAICDQPELRLWVLEEGADRVRVVAHNPTDQELTATVKSGAGYDRVPAFSKTVTVPAGGQVEFTAGKAGLEQ